MTNEYPVTRGDGKHVLIIPSEQFLPVENNLLGIFQYHQAMALRKKDWRVGIVSVSQAYSVPMFLRALVMRSMTKRVGNALDSLSVAGIIKLFGLRLFRPSAFVTVASVDNFPVVRVEGFYYVRPSAETDHFGWIRAGAVGFEEYCRRFGKPDVIHAHNLNPAGLLAQRISKKAHIPYVVTEHSSFFKRGFVPHKLHGALRFAAENAFAVVTVSASLSDTLRDVLCLGDLPLRVIGNVLAPGFTAPLTEQKEKPQFVFLSIGSLIPVKNHATLLSAFADAFPGNAEVRLRIGGDGELLDTLESQASALGIRDRVSFLGRLTPEEVNDEIDACDAFVLPSLVETFGVVVIEALARGKPVVATRCGGPESIVSVHDGILVGADDPVELSAALQTMRDGRAKFDSEKIAQHAIARFGAAEIGEQLVTMYVDAIKAGVS